MHYTTGLQPANPPPPTPVPSIMSVLDYIKGSVHKDNLRYLLHHHLGYHVLNVGKLKIKNLKKASVSSPESSSFTFSTLSNFLVFLRNTTWLRQRAALSPSTCFYLDLYIILPTFGIVYYAPYHTPHRQS